MESVAILNFIPIKIPFHISGKQWEYKKATKKEKFLLYSCKLR